MIRSTFSVLLLVGVAACSRQPARNEAEASAGAPEPVAVRVARAEERKVERGISITGSLHPDETVTVSNEVPGRLAAIRADFGQTVRQGEVIAELDKREFELQLERIRGALAQALARIGLPPEEAGTAPETTPAIRQAQAQLDDARSRYESAAKLVKTGDIASERFVELEKAYSARQAALDAARHELRVSLASIQALRADVALAEKALADATVRAPFDGAVTERVASPGEYLRQNTPIVRLVKTHPLRLRLEVPESAAPAVRTGTELTFTTAALPGETFHAVVREVNPSLDARSRSLVAEARLTKAEARLRPGMFVQVKLVTESAAAIVVVPREAIQTVAGLTKVFTIREGKAVEHRIQPGEEIQGWVEVRGSGIQPGDAVAVSQLPSLTEGTPVRAEGAES
jgi:RND family efflux transporter MFP subunit